MSAIENLPEPQDDSTAADVALFYGEDWLNRNSGDFDAWITAEQYNPDLEIWHVRDERDAAKAMRYLRKWRQRLDEVLALKLAEHDEVDRWFQSEIEKPASMVDRYEHELERFTDELHKSDPARKSFPYPAGTVARREGSEAVEVDTEALLAWAEEHPELAAILTRKTEPKVEPAKAEIKKAVKEQKLSLSKDGEVVDPSTGEVIDGVTIKRADPSFSYKFVETPETEA